MFARVAASAFQITYSILLFPGESTTAFSRCAARPPVIAAVRAVLDIIEVEGLAERLRRVVLIAVCVARQRGHSSSPVLPICGIYGNVIRLLYSLTNSDAAFSEVPKNTKTDLSRGLRIRGMNSKNHGE